MMKAAKRICAVLCALCILFGFSACGCRHEWQDASCAKPKTCLLCAVTEGNALGHDYVDGYCTRCREAAPGFFQAENYGFINSYGMYTWVQVSSYSLGEADANAVFSGSDVFHAIYQFKDGVFNDYSRYENESEGEETKNLTGKLVNTYQGYTVINNDSVSLDGEILTIIERNHDDRGHLVIKALCDSAEAFFILEEQIDWEKSPEITDDNGNGEKQYTYYFKQ